jgi:hypothetical protein
LASESPERLEELRVRFLRALSDLGGGAEEGRPTMVSDVAEGAGLDPEGNPDDRALSERLAAERVDVGTLRRRLVRAASWSLRTKESRRSGTVLIVTITPRLSPRNPIGWLLCATGHSQGVLHSGAQYSC